MQSWICHIEIQCVSIFHWGPLPFLALLSPRLLTVCMCISAALQTSKKPMATFPHEPEKIVIGFAWDRTALDLSKENVV